ncbi:membrane protein [Cellulomonas chitinilytica]|uniref:Membrane protein n=1 Tax=Cellulomonas chitinilytica TaxID=398759 RepID=A0A919U162_9CELL|nr:UbiA family prenyltransferase [Cellulomonas chitinilytica]GIG22763.1 membrane protein [Cellulomonas chitinilytica]
MSEVDVRPRRAAVELALASHPGPTVAVTLFAAAMALGAGAPARTATLVTLAVLAGQLSIGWSNDWVDAARDAAVGRTDKPVGAGRLPVRAVRAAAWAAAAACVVLSATLGWRAGLLNVATVASAWSYNVRLKSSAWSWAPFAFSFGLLPMVVALALPGAPAASWWAVAGGALLGVGAHLANVLPDLEDDEGTGVRGAGHRLGRTGTSVLATGTLLAATLLVVVAPAGRPTPAAVAALVGAAVLAVTGTLVALRATRSRLPFAAAIAVAAVDVVLLVASDWVV